MNEYDDFQVMENSFEKKNKLKVRGKSSVMKMWHRVSYFCSEKINNIKGKTFRDLIIQNQQDDLYILGEKLKAMKNKKEINKNQLKREIQFSKFILICYQQFILQDILIDDVGWGCAIRSGQMLLINFFNVFFDSCSQEILMNIFQKGIFSIQNILQQGNQSCNKQLNQYWSQSEFFVTVQKILEQNDGLIIKNNRHLQKQFCLQHSDGIIYIQNIQEIFEKKQTLLLSINLQLGVYQIETQHKDFFFKIIKKKFFKGMLGGQNKQAYYFFGVYDKYLLYLDPHQIKQIVKQSDFQAQQYQRLQVQKLHPNVTLFFSFNDFQEFKKFQDYVEKKQTNLICFEECENVSESSDSDMFIENLEQFQAQLKKQELQKLQLQEQKQKEQQSQEQKQRKLKQEQQQQLQESKQEQLVQLLEQEKLNKDQKQKEQQEKLLEVLEQEKLNKDQKQKVKLVQKQKQKVKKIDLKQKLQIKNQESSDKEQKKKLVKKQQKSVKLHMKQYKEQKQQNKKMQINQQKYKKNRVILSSRYQYQESFKQMDDLQQGD